MKSSKELVSLIIGLGMIADAFGQVIFFFGLVYWFVDSNFGTYLMLAGIGLVFITRQKVKNIHLIGVIRRRGRRKRKECSLEQEEN